MDGLGSAGRRGFDDVVAELNNTYTATYGLATLLARAHAPETAVMLDRELERYRKLVAELREIHRGLQKE
jgi:hypothetical protein